MDQPFNIGDTYYLPTRSSERKIFPCPVCDGNKAITVTLGDGTNYWCECEGCGLGFSGARGFVEEWVYEPNVATFVIASVKSYRQDNDKAEWRVVSEDGSEAYFHELLPTYDAAIEESRKAVARAWEHCMETHQRKRRDSKRVGWSVRYHNERIRDLERQIAWHRSKVFAK